MSQVRIETEVRMLQGETAEAYSRRLSAALKTLSLADTQREIVEKYTGEKAVIRPFRDRSTA
jgi:hypothetical protein